MGLLGGDCDWECCDVLYQKAIWSWMRYFAGWRNVYVDGAMVKPTDNREEFERQYRKDGPAGTTQPWIPAKVDLPAREPCN